MDKTKGVKPIRLRSPLVPGLQQLFYTTKDSTPPFFCFHLAKTNTHFTFHQVLLAFNKAIFIDYPQEMC